MGGAGVALCEAEQLAQLAGVKLSSEQQNKLWPLAPLDSAGTAESVEEALKVAAEIGKYPLIIRPAFTCGGTGGGIAYNVDEFKRIVQEGIDASMTNQVSGKGGRRWLGWVVELHTYFRSTHMHCWHAFLAAGSG